MNFRWVVFITLWTCLAGPIFAPPPRAVSRPHETRATRLTQVKPASHSHLVEQQANVKPASYQP